MVRLRREIEGVRPNRAIPLPSYCLDAAASSAVLPAFDRYVQGCEPGRTLLAGGVRSDLAIALARAGHWVTVSDLDATALERLHVHISGIQYGQKGERRHEPLLETAFRWKELLRALKDLRVSGWVVSESPAMEDDALLLQKTYRRLK